MLNTKQIDALYTRLGALIKTEREKANYKQTTFASILQISRPSLVNIEKGKQRAPLHILYEIARVLKIDINSLLPDINQLTENVVNKDIERKIENTSAGDEELHKKLMEFVKSASPTTKILL